MRLIRLLKYDLAKEITAWAQDGIISREQAALICRQYGIDFHNQARKSFGYFILVAFGYLFVGLSIITLLSANWEEIPRMLRMAGLILITLGINLLGIRKFKAGEKTSAIGCFFLGGLFYGASIMLIAQIYHIGEHFPDGIFWWAMGVLPAAILLESSLIMMLAAGLGYLWFFAESSLHYYPAMFPLFLIALAWHVFNVKQSNVLFLLLMTGIAIWAEYLFSWILGNFQQFYMGPEIIMLVFGLFLIFHGFSRRLAAGQKPMLVDYGTLLSVWVLRFAVISLFIFSFKHPWLELINATWESPAGILFPAIGFSVFGIWMSYVSGGKIFSAAFFSAFYLAGLLCVIHLSDHDAPVFLQIADNFMLVTTGIWLIVRGIQNGISHYFFLGVLIILLTGLLRYIDLVGDYVGTAVLFAVFAAILLFTAKYWKKLYMKTGMQP